MIEQNSPSILHWANFLDFLPFLSIIDTAFAKWSDESLPDLHFEGTRVLIGGDDCRLSGNIVVLPENTNETEGVPNGAGIIMDSFNVDGKSPCSTL